MDRAAHLFMFVLCIFVENVSNKINNQKICVVGNPGVKISRTTKFCDLLENSKRPPVTCTYREDRLSCLVAVSRREADFGVFEAEDLYFSTLAEQSSVLVVSEVRGLKKKPYSYGFVVLVAKDVYVNRVEDLRGKKLCHPGVESGPEWNSLFGQYFEERVAPANCDQGLSIYEDRIKATSEFFEEACIAGPWVGDSEEDTRLKAKYSNLCSLCDSGDCSKREKYRGSGGSIVCLRDNVGEILWARYEDVKVHLKFLEEESLSNYYYFCEDGRKMLLSSEEPCIWLAKPWQVIVANTKSATDVQKIVEILSDDDRSGWEENLLSVMELHSKYIRNLPVSVTPEDYLRKIPGYLSASVMSEGTCKPRRTLKLCVSSFLEFQKCQKMSKAAPALAIQPTLECVQENHTLACLDSVAKKETDVVVVPPDFLYVATRYFHLRTFLQETGKELKDSYLVSFIVRKNSGMKTLGDLKLKRVCFTRKHGIGWNAFASVLQKESVVGSVCNDAGAFEKYFADICVMDGDDQVKKCCPSLDATWVDENRDEIDALRCLRKKGCDVAVVDYNTLLQYSDGKNSLSDLDFSEFRIICRSEKESECHWTWSYPNFLMTHVDTNSSKAVELFNVFYQIDQNFGKRSYKSNDMMKIFGPFEQTSNVLFKDTSTSFISHSEWKHPNDYNGILQQMKICSKSSPSQSFTLFTLIFTLSSFFFIS